MRFRGFIFEGCDRAGKSTLANAVAEKIGAVVSHNNKSSVDWSTDDAIFRAMNHSPVIDRLYDSEYVYASIIGRSTTIDFARLSTLWRLQDDNRYITVMVRSPENVIRERYKTSLDEYVDADTAIRVQSLFHETYKKRDSGVLFVDGNADPDRFEKTVSGIVGLYALD